MEFERAAALRDRIKALTQVQTAQGINPARDRGRRDRPASGNGQACVQVFFIRANQNWGNRDFYPRVGRRVAEPEVLEAFIGPVLRHQGPAPLILLAPDREHRSDAAGLSEKAGRKVEIAGDPKRGEKAELMDAALRNARESLARKWPKPRRKPSC